MRMLVRGLLVAVSGFGLWAQSAVAVPVLQVDIEGGWYVGGAESSIVTDASSFNLYTYLVEKQGATTADTFRLSIALLPKPDSQFPVPSFGSFSVNGVTYDVGNMTYGTPPIEAFSNADELPGHGIYDTYYLEIDYQFDPNNQAKAVDVQSNGGLGPQAGTGMFYTLWQIDVSNLLAGFFLHFDTYDPSDPERIKAPFSHDGRTIVPEPSTLLLLGAGLIGLAFTRRRVGARRG